MILRYTSDDQSMNENGNQFHSDYKRKNRNIIHENSYQRGIIPIKYDNSGFQVRAIIKERTEQLTWLMTSIFGCEKDRQQNESKN